MTKTAEKQYTRGEFYKEDADHFYSMMFNKWKNSILALTKDQFIELYQRGSYGQDFIKMRQFLKTIPDVKTQQEANDVFRREYDDKELQGALEKYKWTAFGEYSGWVHVCSRYVTAKQDKVDHIEHRLYLNTESVDTYKMLNLLVEKFDEHHLPYYFKFSEYADRDDTIVIYSSTENLAKYVELLQEIKKEHPDLVSRLKEPPVLTGKIDNWIGYGSEPSETSEGEKQSFNDVRSKVIEPAISKVTKEWIMEHRNMQITYKGQKLTFQDYVAMRSTERLIESLEKKFQNYEEHERKAAQREGIAYNPNSVIEKLGYTPQIVRTSAFKENIYGIIRSKMSACLTNVCNGIYNSVYGGTYKDMPAINMDVRNGKQIQFSGYDLETTIDEILVKISKNDPKFINSVRLAIVDNAKQYGIDIDKFCFDITAREKMRMAEAKDQQTREKVKEEQSTITQQPQQDPTTKKSNNIDLANLDIQTFPKTINPYLLRRKMKLPNGAEIPANQYIQEVVYPQIPENSIIILKNGAPISAQQFIEEFVMSECQNKYNGDFARYITDKTRNNIGVISIRNYGKSYQINPVEITEFINPALLKRKMKLPNGAEISASQYIQEVYAPYIPTNGYVILTNGAKISAQQYIEEVLLYEGQAKYNGDISQILYNTTKRNTGIINSDSKKIQEAVLELRSQLSNE